MARLMPPLTKAAISNHRCSVPFAKMKCWKTRNSSRQHITTAGNGQVENANKTVKSLLMAKGDSEPETFINGINPILAYVWERGTVATRCDDG